MGTMMIECGDHGRAPASAVCIHLARGTSNRWHGTLLEGEEVPGDWLCPECEPHPWDLGLRDIEMWCMHCVRRIQEERGATVTIHDGTRPAEE